MDDFGNEVARDYPAFRFFMSDDVDNYFGFYDWSLRKVHLI